MAVYKFRVTFEEHEDVSRDLEIKSTQSFEDLHSAILGSIGFDTKENASFYMSDDNWKKGREISLTEKTNGETKLPLMKKSRLCDFIADPHQKIYYIYDFTKEWTFHVELLKIIVSEDAGVIYPRCIKINGEAPKQHDTAPKIVPVPEDFIEEEVYVEEISEAETEETEGEEGEKISLDELTPGEPDAEEEQQPESEE
jgi:hypothetical protein